jgi:predicted permease
MIADWRFAFRQLWKTPGFTLAAVLVLALGIGVNTSVFSLLNAMLFAPPSYAQPGEIAQIFQQDKKNPKTFRAFSYPTYRDVRDRNTVFRDVLAHNLAMVGIGEKSDARRAFAAMVSSNYFSVLGVMPAQGRAFLPEEETPGKPTEVAIVSHNYAVKHQGNGSILGSSMTINGRPYTIVGVMPPNFSGTMTLFAPEVWLPLSVYDRVANNFAGEGKESLGDRTGHQLLLIGRLKEGMSLKSADPGLKTLGSNLEAAFPVEQKDQTFMATSLSRFSTSNSPSDDSSVQAIGPLLICTALIVLLVASLNLANMLLARGTARRKEIAIRLALGGTRGRIVRQLLTEGLVLALLGGGAGLLLANWSSSILMSSISRLVPLDLVWSTGLNATVLAATFGFCLFATLCFALGPALKVSKASVVGDLKENAGEDFVRRRWRFLPRHPLVVIQIALSLALLTAAALFLRAAREAASVETGLKAERDYLVEVDATLGGRSAAQARDIYNRTEARLAALPGVESASISSTIPFGMISLSRSMQRAGMHVAADAKPSTAAEGLAFSATWNSVGSDYFPTVGLPVVRGRVFTAAETTQPGGPAVAIIDSVLAKKLWPDGDALGQRIQYASSAAPKAKGGEGGGVGVQELGGGDIQPEQPIEVVGIVPATASALFDKEQPGAVYLPFARGFQSNVFFYVKMSSIPRGSEAGTADLLRRTVREVDSTIPVLTLKTFPQHLDTNMQLWIVRAAATMFSIFGGVALGLAVVGIYGVKAYSVARRTREIGIRMALGARPGAVQWMILREGAVMLAAGLVIGLLLAFGTGKAISGMLYHVGSLDLVAFTTAPLFIAAATLIATWLPARRATRITPMSALRTE